MEPEPPAAHQGPPVSGVFDTSRLRGIRSLREFDDRITAFYCGFTGADDYYDRSAAAHVLGRIAVPTFILNAANDPFIRILPETRREDFEQSAIHVRRNRRRRPLLLPGQSPTAAVTAAGPRPRS
jgi:predicted alpha/beta-fold hydrolase